MPSLQGIKGYQKKLLPIKTPERHTFLFIILLMKNSELRQIGIKNPEEISGYRLKQINDTDHLIIRFKRALFSKTRQFKFGRFTKTVVTDSGQSAYETSSEISPRLLRLLTELDHFVKPGLNKVSLMRKTFQNMKKITPKGDLSWYIKWVAAVFILISMVLTATDYHPLNLYFNLIGVIGWLVVGILWKDRALIVLNGAATIIFIAGIGKTFL